MNGLPKLLCLSFILIFSLNLFAQQPVHQGRTASAAPSPKSSNTRSAEDEAATEQRKQNALLKIKGFVDRALKFSTIRAKTQTLSTIGELLWKYDEQYARELLLKSLDMITNEMAVPSQQTPAAGQTAEQAAAQYQRSLGVLRGMVLSRIARHDVALAKRLADNSTSSETSMNRGQNDMQIAMSLWRDNPTAALEFAERSLNKGLLTGSVREGSAFNLVMLLFALRRTNVAQADALYVKALNSLVAQPNVDAETLLYMGTYVYAAPIGDPSEYTVAGMMPLTGNIGIPNISIDRPNASPDAVRAYLDAALRILTREITDPRQQQLYYAAAYLLLPRVERVFPQRAPLLQAAMQALSANVPRELTQEETYTRFATRPKTDVDVDAAMQQVDNITDSDRRDDMCLMFTYGLYRTNKFADARLFAAKVQDLSVRSQLENEILFGEAREALARNNAHTAEEAAAKLSPSIESAVLWMKLARIRSAAGDRTGQTEALRSALEDARRTDDYRRTSIMLAAASDFLPIDASTGLQALSDAVKAFNEAQLTEEEAREGESIQFPNWWRRIKTKHMWRPFPLLAGPDNFYPYTSLSLIAKVNPEDVSSSLMDFSNEDLLGQALMALSTAWVNQINTPPKQRQ